MTDPLKGIPKRGDVYGDASTGHRVTEIYAAVLIQADGNEGMLSQWLLTRDGEPMGRFAFVTSNPEGELAVMQQMLATQELPAGARIEWRTYTFLEAVD